MIICTSPSIPDICTRPSPSLLQHTVQKSQYSHDARPSPSAARAVAQQRCSLQAKNWDREERGVSLLCTLVFVCGLVRGRRLAVRNGYVRGAHRLLRNCVDDEKGV